MSQSPTGLRRELRTWQSLALSIAMMSPTLAIAVYGGAPALYVGRAAPLAFLLSGLGVILVGTGLVYLCRYFSHAGSVYGLTGVTLGPRAGFFSGWALLGTYVIYTPASAAASAYFLTLFCKDTGIWPGANWLLFALIFIAVIFLLAVRDIARIGRVLLSVEGLSIIVMLIVLAVVIARLAGGAHGNHLTLQVFSLPGGVSFHSLVLASVFGFTAFAGFEGAASLGEETRNPRRSIPRALSIAIAAGVVFYVFCVAVMAMGFGITGKDGTAFASSSGPLFDLSRTYFSTAMAQVLELGATVSAFSAALGSTLGGGRLIFALARDTRPGSRLAGVGRNGAPASALTLVLAFAAAMVIIMYAAGNAALTTSFYLGTIGTLSLLVAYAMVDLGAVRLMARDARRKAVLIIPLLGFLVLAYTMYNELYPRPPQPYDYFPYIVAGWLVIGLVAVVAGPGAATRIGRGLAEAEGMAALADEDAPAIDVREARA
jgi:amino acid transporter